MRGFQDISNFVEKCENSVNSIGCFYALIKVFLIWCNHYRGGLFSDTLISASKTFMRRDYLRSKVITYSHACILCKNTWTHHDSQLHVVNRAHKQPKFDWWCNRTIAKTCYTIQYRSAWTDWPSIQCSYTGINVYQLSVVQCVHTIVSFMYRLLWCLILS